MKLAIPNISPQRAIDLAAAMAALLLAVGAAWRLGGWAWLVMAPAVPAAAPDMHNEINVALIASRPWFGNRVAPSAPTTTQQARGTTLRVIGIVAGGKRPAAIVGAGNSAPQAVLEGETIAPGIVLKTVNRDHVIVTRDGMPERVELPAKPAAELNKGNTANEEPQE